MKQASSKGNHARKVLLYYSINFNICAPFQVLCDGPTIFQSLKNDIYLKQALPTLLGATAYPVVTNCIVKELRSLGENYSNAALFAKRATRVPCAHEGQLTANECIVTLFRTNLESKLLLATNDIEILAKVSKTPGIPLITIVNQTKLALKGPSKATVDYVRLCQAAKSSVLSKQDQVLLEKVRADEAASRPERMLVRKRKKAKGPNPLSVKKRKITSTVKQSSSDKIICDIDDKEAKLSTALEVRRESQAEVNESSSRPETSNVVTVPKQSPNSEKLGLSRIHGTKRKRRRKKRVHDGNEAPKIVQPRPDGNERPKIPQSPCDHERYDRDFRARGELEQELSMHDRSVSADQDQPKIRTVIQGEGSNTGMEATARREVELDMLDLERKVKKEPHSVDDIATEPSRANTESKQYGKAREIRPSKHTEIAFLEVSNPDVNAIITPALQAARHGKSISSNGDNGAPLSNYEAKNGTSKAGDADPEVIRPISRQVASSPTIQRIVGQATHTPSKKKQRKNRRRRPKKETKDP